MTAVLYKISDNCLNTAFWGGVVYDPGDILIERGRGTYLDYLKIIHPGAIYSDRAEKILVRWYWNVTKNKIHFLEEKECYKLEEVELEP